MISQKYDSVANSGTGPGILNFQRLHPTAQNFGHSARVKYRSSFVNFYYATFMETLKKMVKQAKVGCQESNF